MSDRRDVVGKPLAHDSARQHVTGAAIYLDDMAETAGALHAALVKSPHAKARIRGFDASAALALPGVVAFVTAADIPGQNEVGPIFHGEPALAEEIADYVGCPVGAVVATSHEAAKRAADLVQVDWEPLPAILSIADAIAAESWTSAPQRLVYGDPDAALAKAARRLTGGLDIGGQDHFYLETNIAIAAPLDEGQWHVWSSTQHPTEVQKHVALVLGVPQAAVTAEVRRMGGGFGGKESQPTIIAAIAAVCAHKTGRPVKLRLDRDDDMIVTGKRHDFRADWEVAFDDDGAMTALRVRLAARGGNVADLTSSVMTRAICHVTNCYYAPNVEAIGLCCKTNTVSNTAFRGFGGPQGMLVGEAIIDQIARHLKLDRDAVRRANYYSPATRTDDALRTAGQRHDRRRADGKARGRRFARAAARGDRRVQRAQSLDEARARHRARDVRHQLQHAEPQPGRRARARLYGRLHPGEPRRHGNGPGPVHESGAGGGRNLRRAGGVRDAHVDAHRQGAEHVGHGGLLWLRPQRRRRAQRRARHPRAHDAGRRAGMERAGRHDRLPRRKGHVGQRVMAFGELARTCWLKRVSLSASGFYSTPKIHWDQSRLKGHPFYYFAYGAAASEVEIDLLTGETRCLRTDIVHDCGDSLNPALDMGQIEGGFVQGMGWLTMEELYWDKEGRLRTHAPSTYKIPGSRDAPADFRVHILENAPNREETIFRSKAVGEPPLMLAMSVWLAIRDAVTAAGADESSLPNAPATPEKILMALEKGRA